MDIAVEPSETPRLTKTLVLVGLMGAGKSCIGRHLAQRLALEFVDADSEIEAAAGCSIEDIFDLYGEDAFRDVERRVIARILDGPVRVLATGGGAFVDPRTRALVRDKGISLWLRADLDLLAQRVARRADRPLLKGKDSRQVLRDLITRRYPIYGEADVVVDSGREAPEATAGRALAALDEHLAPADG